MSSIMALSTIYMLMTPRWVVSLEVFRYPISMLFLKFYVHFLLDISTWISNEHPTIILSKAELLTFQPTPKHTALTLFSCH